MLPVDLAELGQEFCEVGVQNPCPSTYVKKTINYTLICFVIALAHNFFGESGPCQTSNFYKQYCDKKIERYCNKNILFSLWCELKISIHGYFSWFWKQKQYFVKKNIALSQYRFIAILLVKMLVWRGPQSVLGEKCVIIPVGLVKDNVRASFEVGTLCFEQINQTAYFKSTKVSLTTLLLAVLAIYIDF